MTNIITDKILNNNDKGNCPPGTLNYLKKSIRLHLYDNIYLFFDEKKKYLSLCPIIPINKVDLIMQLYKLKISKKELKNSIKNIIGEENIKIYNQNKIKIQQIKDEIKIIDEQFIKDCIFLSKENLGGDCIIAERISNSLYNNHINYVYRLKEGTKQNYCLAYFDIKNNMYIQSDLFNNKNEAKLDVNKKIIKKYFKEKNSNEMINNIVEYLKKKEKSKSEKRLRYEKYLDIFGGDRKLLKKKRCLPQEEFSKRLPYFNMLDKDKKNKKVKNNNSSSIIIDEGEDSEEIEIFRNTEHLPLNQISLGDFGIVESHLTDFKYTPLKIFEMIRDSEKERGVDFTENYIQLNDKNYCITNEYNIISQKLGLNIQGFGKTKEEAENKCALNVLTKLFKDKFKTYCELHDYFENKKGKYLDIILNKGSSKENDTIENYKIIKKSEQNIKKISLNKWNVYSNNNNDNNDNISIYSIHSTSENNEINKSVINNIGSDFFNLASNINNSNALSMINESYSSNNSLTNNKLLEELNKNEKENNLIDKDNLSEYSENKDNLDDEMFHLK